jgi:hypothetical protein
MPSGTLYGVALFRTDILENVTLKMEAICSPNCRFELVLHGTKSQKAFIIDTAMKASQRTVFFDHIYYPSVVRLINSDSTVTELWNCITPKNPEDGGNMLSKMSV